MKTYTKIIYTLALFMAGLHMTQQPACSMDVIDILERNNLQPDSEIEMTPYRLNYRIKIDDWEDLLLKKVAPQLSLKDTLNLSIVSKTSLQNFCRYCSLVEQEIGIKRDMMSLQSDDEHFSFKNEGYNRAQLFKPYEIFEMQREYKIVREMEEIIEENRRRNFICWGEIPECTPQLLNLINDGFIELMSLSMNQFVLNFDSSDTTRFEKLVHRLKAHLPEKSLIFQAVCCLSYDSFLFGKETNNFPNLRPFIEQKGFDNEKSLYLFFRYLYGEKPNIQKLVSHRLYSQVKGAMGGFIRSQEIVHPIRLKLPAWRKKKSNEAVTFNDIKDLILHDPGVLKNEVASLIYNIRDFKWWRIYLGREGLDKLANYVIKRDFFKHYDLNMILLRLYRTKESEPLYPKLLHRYLQTEPTYSRDHVISCHEAAKILFKRLKKWDLVDYHAEKIKQLKLIEEKEEKEQREEYRRRSAQITKELMMTKAGKKWFD